MKLIVKPLPPYNFDLVAGLYSRFPSQCVDLYDQVSFQRALKIGSNVHLIKVSSIGTVELPELTIEVTPETKEKEFVKDKVMWMLGGDEDLGGFYQIGRRDKRFAKVIEDLYGLRPPRTPTVFEALIIAISEQQIALPVAIAIRKRLAEKYGDSVTVNGTRYFSFPSPESLARARPEDIRALKFTTKKAEYIVDIARRVVGGELDLEAMRDWSVEKAVETLTKIRGIGPWTVEYMMVRGMARHDALPASDIGLRASLTKFLGRSERVSEKEVREFLEPFGKYKGNAAFYLIYNYAFAKYPKKA